MRYAPSGKPGALDRHLNQFREATERAPAGISNDMLHADNRASLERPG